jgi:hypothetical protein
MTDQRHQVRLRVRWRDSDWYFVRFLANSSPELTPREQINQAALLDRSAAAAIRDRLQGMGLTVAIIDRFGTVLYDSATPTPGSTSPPTHSVESRELVPHHAKIGEYDVLILPCAHPLGSWLVRFPGHAQLIKGESPDDCIDKLVTMFPKFIHLAERYVAPPEQPTPTAETRSNARPRPGNR